MRDLSRKMALNDHLIHSFALYVSPLVEKKELKKLSSVQFGRSVVSNSLWLHGLQHERPPCPSPTPEVYWNSCPLNQWTSIDAIQPCHPLLSPSLPAFNLSQHQVHPIFPSIKFYSNESVLCIRWPKRWTFSFSISPSNEYSGLSSFRMDLLAVQGTLRSHLQYLSWSISSSLLSFLYSPTLTSIQDYWKNHSFD